MKLYMLLLGALPPGRTTEQHDVFFGIAENLAALKDDIINCWPEAGSSLHIDVSREVNTVDGYKVEVMPAATLVKSSMKLFFVNLGGYKQNEFEEYHYKMPVAATDKATAVRKAKATAFYKHYNLKGAPSHIDEKYGIDVDDLYDIDDILSEKYTAAYRLILTQVDEWIEDRVSPGYLRINKL